jgi:hypothetical protein
VAERLVYRKPGRQVNLAVKPDRTRYVPGEPATVTLTATDEHGKPAPAVVMAAVVDKSVITMADEKTARAMPTHFYLTTEVRRPEDLEHADFLLGTHPQAAAALDRLLATQGWRRFAEQDPHKFRQEQREDAERLLVCNGQASDKTVNFLQKELQRIQAEAGTRRRELLLRQARAEEASESLNVDNPLAANLRRLRDEEQDVLRERAAAVNELDAWDGRARAMAVPVLAGALLALAAAGILLGLFRNLRQAIPFYATAVCSVLLAAGLGLWLTENRPQAPGGAFNVADAGVTLLPAVGGGEADQREARRLNERLQELPRAAKAMPAPAAAEPRSGVAPVAPPPPANKPAAPVTEMARDRPDVLKEAPPGADPAWRDIRGFNLPMKDDKGNAEKGAQALLRMKEAKDAALAAPQAQAELATKHKVAGARPRGDLGAAGGIQAAGGGKGKAGAPGMPAGTRGPGMAGDLEGMPRAGLGVPGGGFGGAPRGGALGFAPPGLNQPAGEAPLGGEARMGRRQLMAGLMKAVPEPEPIVVREYAHLRRPGSDTDLRSDFVDTICWQPVLVLPDGKGQFSFDLCDSVTTFQVTAYGHTPDGRLGAAKAMLESRLPFAVEPKLPVEVTAGDRIDVPVSIANNTREARPVQVRLTPTGLALEQGKPDEPLTVPADGRARRIFRLRPTLVQGEARVHIAGTAAPFTDSIVKSLPVVPDGFPVVQARSDVLETAAVNEITLPERWIERTLQCQVQVYPSTLASLQQGLEALLREPNGCFEQTSTTSYPNVLILNYLKESDQARPEVERRARDLLARGYQKLISFECPQTGKPQRQGYEWFGAPNSAHEALTAYGLLQFRDMARVQDVDPAMLERTRAYLLARRDGKGGFQRNPRALDHFGRAPEAITNAYIIWALTESGNDDDVEKELSTLAQQAQSSKDPYFLALVANSLLNRGKADEGGALLKTLAAAQKPDGHLDAARTSITGSGGRDLQIETTALAVLAWLKGNRPEFILPVQNAVKWIGQQRGGYGGFGSTQSTILALKALIAFTKANKKTAEPGEVQLFVGKDRVAHLAFPAGAQDVLTLSVPEPEKHLKAGKNTLRVEVTGKNVFPYTLSVSYRTQKPLSAEGCPVRLTTKLDRQAAVEGETVRLNVRVENVSGKGQGMTVAIVGLPAGLSLPEDMKQLKDYARLRDDGKEPGLISFWELKNRELVLYWRDLAPDQKIEVPIDLICRVPGEYRGPASRAYLYYNADRKHWVEPLGMAIQARSE